MTLYFLTYYFWDPPSGSKNITLLIHLHLYGIAVAYLIVHSAVMVDSINSFKSRLDKCWSSRDLVDDYSASLLLAEVQKIKFPYASSNSRKNNSFKPASYDHQLDLTWLQLYSPITANKSYFSACNVVQGLTDRDGLGIGLIIGLQYVVIMNAFTIMPVLLFVTRTLPKLT